MNKNKIKLIVPNLLLSGEPNLKDNKQVINLEYSKPVSIEQILNDNKINRRFLGLIILNCTKIVDKKYLVKESCELEFFLLMGGG